MSLQGELMIVSGDEIFDSNYWIVRYSNGKFIVIRHTIDDLWLHRKLPVAFVDEEEANSYATMLNCEEEV
jgi:hypothetical protein